ncbi:MAG TPA: amidohydrolase family protein, partial [Thermodesulfobacteriota bacterium]|nr:amidohydrolase family protein [Thermodesulfobacteriota bacterium]
MNAATRREFLHAAAMGAAAGAASAASAAEKRDTMKKKTPVIDMHSHMEVPEAVALLPEKPAAASSPTSAASAAHQERLFQMLKDQLQNPEKKIEDMDKAGIDVSIISLAPPQMFYNLEGALAVDVVRKQNETIAGVAQKYPARFLAMATVPLQSPDAAAQELDRAVRELKMKGVQVASNVRGQYLGEPKFLPFFETAAKLDIPVFIHPTNVAGTDRMKFFYFSNLVGNPLDTTITAGHLIFSGIFDRLPNLKIVLAHAGGMLPYNIDRWGHGWEVRPEFREILKKSPVEYIRNFYYDTITHGPATLKFLLSRVGVDRIVMG